MNTNQITAIKPLADDPSRVSVHVGRRRVATLMLSQLEMLSLAVGLPWDDALADRVGEAALIAKARRDAMRIVNRRAIGSAQMVERLTRKGHPPHIARHVAQMLVEKKVLDDEAMGRAMIQTQLARKPAGKLLLRQKLRQQKLPGEMVNRLVDQAEAGRDAVADARRLAESKLRSSTMKKLDAQARKRRVWGALARRGFEPGTIIEALKNLPGLSRDDDMGE